MRQRPRSCPATRSWRYSVEEGCIGIFAVGPGGALTFVGEEWTRGDYPRSFNFDPPGRFLYCCNQRADAVAVFRVDRRTGGLDFTGSYSPVGNPSIIVFLDLATVR